MRKGPKGVREKGSGVKGKGRVGWIKKRRKRRRGRQKRVRKGKMGE
jgi:hypothetical protein